MDKRKCILFGAGIIGKRVYFKLQELYDIKGYADNDVKLQGKIIMGAPIMDPFALSEMEDIVVVICSYSYKEIYYQLKAMDIKDIFVVDPLSYEILEMENDRLLYYPDVLNMGQRLSVKRVLFVQKSACIRTYRIAFILKKNGIDVDLAYQYEHPEYQKKSFFSNVFTKIFPINSFREFVRYVNQEDYDIVHCSNEPDALANIALCTNKKVVHDTHDMVTLCREVTPEKLAMEYIANTKSHGNMYASPSVMEYAIRRYGMDRSRVVAMENYVLEDLKPENFLPKLSAKDGEIHCVYEGGLHSNPKSYRYLEKYWKNITRSKIHVHFYTNCNAAYCEEICKNNAYLHYEGWIEERTLMRELTQYDCGLISFNVTPSNRAHLEYTTANKMFEYLLAGLPVVVSDVASNREFVEKYRVGAFLDMEKDIYEQISKIISIEIDKDFLIKNELTMDAKAHDLIAFYNYILQR